ncbi:myo-inositol 2-dehydrogenase [Devosia limi DSM 17137]|uniref:Myo-inositol 2-dehydrogenase n=1 Tax=Devosia limi DSM 17137 TaxID=1121477 RepID=A0A0F5LJX5_9HYPH|nr:Gfo/Idh/MocA family oxidoreductase [Devosia limi]KKB82633.1 myo-inositol 2-dehydrogenase [Devosia limi DSM 17137]SHE42355.1 Oxidoreductase family, C-terminal alpha/beta domain [Devosia limi DSM 17137]
MKYAIVGTGGRHQMFRDAVAITHADTAELVALCDVNQSRLALSASKVPDPGGNGVATYLAEDFDRMIAEQQPDTVIVTTPDFLHDDYIVRALRAGRNVMTEKPMTIDVNRLKRILDAQRETGKSVTVTFNYRYSPARTQLKDLLMSGVIGDITAIDFRWYLDRVHGADYFRRWHRYKDKSGGLLVHKSTHHFDLLNWWAASTPKTVTAVGKRDFYTPQMAVKLGLEGHGERCHACPVADRCEFRMDLEADEALKELYLDAEDDDGYWRDKCVFADDITIEDTMQVQAQYASGTSLNYTLVAYSPWEGLEVKFHGTKGELTHKHIEVHGVFAGGDRDKTERDNVTTELHLAGKLPEKLAVWEGTGSHGGADPIMLGYLFDPQHMEADRYGRASDQVAGAWSILTGIAANQSIARNGERISVDAMLAEAGIDLGEKR